MAQPNLSIIDNFEVLRRRYMDTLRDRRRSGGTRRPRVQRDQIAEKKARGLEPAERTQG